MLLQLFGHPVFGCRPENSVYAELIRKGLEETTALLLGYNTCLVESL